MSTEFTRLSPNAGYELVDSHALSFTQAADSFRDRMVHWLLSRLHDDGFPELKSGQLTFLGSLDCGANFAAELARRLRISRQAVHKTVKDLEAAGWLTTQPDAELGNQRVIVFTDEGERMMACARAHFLTLDTQLMQTFGAEKLAAVRDVLNFDPDAPNA
ncbi:MAG: MarR family winged helix-turn-helix transcriptional regulator [Pacificibacter sp.]|uniref:MarR family winged helix-turn-helix transcriptional regulator n=1 Tax=Pacificibacter sp. TaxID=1917866 RepID=UPI00321AEC4D